jgi:tetratricopeptide (TPR) repeat protein
MFVDVEDNTNRQKRLVDAFKKFQAVVSFNADCPLAEMGLAACHYAMKNFQQALILYATILHKYASTNTNVRLAMGWLNKRVLKVNVHNLMCNGLMLAG